MSAEIIILPMETTLDLPPDRVLDAALGKLSTAIIMGYQTETGEPYFAGSTSDVGAILLLAERLKAHLLSL
jgi:hypothetical protein